MKLEALLEQIRERHRQLPFWRIGSELEQHGLLPRYSARLLEGLKAMHGELPPPDVEEERALAEKILGYWWKIASINSREAQTHILVGPAGSGKTTVLCKWLAQAVLLGERNGRVWRLDMQAPNSAEFLSGYCEVLGVPVLRSRAVAEQLPRVDLSFVDFPGIDWQDATALAEMRGRLTQFPGAKIHLVLNAAYDTSIMLEQIRAFTEMPLTSLIFTHLDEEMRWGKLLNFLLATDYAIGLLSAGQNIPGTLLEAQLGHIFPGAKNSPAS